MKEVIIKHTRLYEKKISNLMDLDKRQTFENDIAKHPTFHPTFHPIVPGTSGIRKARIALEGRGKRGGARVCYYYVHSASIVYFLTIYAKNEKVNLTPDDKKALKSMVKIINDFVEGDVK
jgi:mRNA-degrading endonuclease RelE of RelBE toxin-antitoxin system